MFFQVVTWRRRVLKRRWVILVACLTHASLNFTRCYLLPFTPVAICRCPVRLIQLKTKIVFTIKEISPPFYVTVIWITRRKAINVKFWSKSWTYLIVKYFTLFLLTIIFFLFYFFLLLLLFYFFFHLFISLKWFKEENIPLCNFLAQRAGSQTIGSNTHAVTAVPFKGFDWIKAFTRGPTLASRV